MLYNKYWLVISRINTVFSGFVEYSTFKQVLKKVLFSNAISTFFLTLQFRCLMRSFISECWKNFQNWSDSYSFVSVIETMLKHWSINLFWALLWMYLSNIAVALCIWRHPSQRSRFCSISQSKHYFGPKYLYISQRILQRTFIQNIMPTATKPHLIPISKCKTLGPNNTRVIQSFAILSLVATGN